MSLSRLIIGCGYLGRRVANRWLAEGIRVYALTRSPERAAEFARTGLIPLVGDVMLPASLPDFPAVDALLYAVGLDRRSGHTQRDVYVGGLTNVLPRIADKARRAIYISSTSVYGQIGGEWVDESSDCRPETANGQVCLESERLIQQSIPESNVLRLAGIYGPGRLAARIDSLRAGIAPEGNPNAWLNLIHIDDAVSAVLACEQHAAPGATFVVSDNQPCRRREYYTLLAGLIGAPPPFPTGASRRDDAARTTANTGSTNTNLNKRCNNRRLRDELRVDLRFPDIQRGLPAALAMS
jgi:nucleoside-diphosphate-sugar epimerase